MRVSVVKRCGMPETFALTINESYSVTLPIGLRHLLKLRQGDELEIEADENQILTVKLYRSGIFTPEIHKILEGRAAGKFTEGLEPLRRGRAASV
jgi:bifunctional DNA-binding transcriptional regulator/antitoxin component of YhaV-PrlF toxin-antitoxin module